MINLSLHKYAMVGLLSLIDKLDKDYYDVVINLCEGALNNANKLKELEVQRSASQYIVRCNNLITEICKYVTERKDHLVPYIHELQEKDTTNHDCRNCSGNCHMLHKGKLAELQESHKDIRDILSRLQMMSLPLHAETIYPDVYRLLRNQMMLLENILSDLLFLEETYLIPKVKEAQKNINVRS